MSTNRHLLGALLFLLAIATFQVANVAVAANRQITIRGSQSCAQWTEARKNGDQSISILDDVRWALGYLSGLNENSTGHDVVESTDGDLVRDWITNYCSKFPNKRIDDAVRELFNKLKKL